MKIALIGGSGFVGTRLLDLLKEDTGKYELQNIDLQHSLFFDDVTVLGDVRDQGRMAELLSGCDLVVLLAARHRDDVSPVSLYYDTNVGGMESVLNAMETNGVRRLIFFSSVAVYGLNKPNPDEDYSPKEPFNHYGKSKLEAESLAEKWHLTHPDWNINVVRPTVIFGERNRGNVYNLLRQISIGRFMMVGNGRNVKSMAYVGNVVAFVKFLIENVTEGYNVYNYIDKPDMSMNDLVEQVRGALGKRSSFVRLPYWIGMTGGLCFDYAARVTGKNLPISSVRVKKFCATTQFDSSKAMGTGFHPPFSIAEGLSRTLEFEWINPTPGGIKVER